MLQLALDGLQNIYTPSNSSIYNQWFNIGTVFGIAIDLEKNIYLSALPIMYGTASVGLQVQQVFIKLIKMIGVLQIL